MKKFFNLLVLGLCVFGLTACGEVGPEGPKGDPGIPGEPGQDGRGVESITLTNTEGNVDTYTITYSDGSTSTFTVTNGEDGSQGIQGEPGQDGHTPVITISSDGYWVIDGVKTDIKAEGQKGEDGSGVLTGNGVPSNDLGKDNDSYIDLETFNFYVKENGVWKLKGNIKGQDGNDGLDGKGIESITLTSSEGNVDTYTITYTDGSTSTFTIANGTSSEEQTYNITFDLNGGQFLSDYNESNYVDVLKGDCVNLPIPYRFGYTFEGWYTGKSINDIQFSNYTPLNGDTNLIAKWINDFYADEIRQQRSEYATDIHRYFYGYFGEYIDVVPSEYIDTINYFVNELNFASDLDELEQLYNSFTIWLYEDLIVLDQMVDSIKNNLVDSWNNFLSEMSELSSSEYQQMYDDLLLEIENSENININKHDELNRRVTQFIMDVENYINNNSLDESRKKLILKKLILIIITLQLSLIM